MFFSKMGCLLYNRSGQVRQYEGYLRQVVYPLADGCTPNVVLFLKLAVATPGG